MWCLKDELCHHNFSRIFRSCLKYWIIILTVGPSTNYGLSSSSADAKSELMMRKNVFLLTPNLPTSADSNAVLQTSTMLDNSSDDKHQLIPNYQIDHHNSATSDNINHNLVMIGDNDENYFELFRTPMRFGTENHTVITTQIGATAHIPCTIHHIGEGVVTWIRKNDHHLLTVGLTTYSSDERFSATHIKNSEDWTLQIKFVQLRDASNYECQVSTHPPTSIFLELNVVEARAEIVGPSLKYLTPGSTLKLICKVLLSTEPTAYIFWYHDNRMINYDLDRGINVSSEADFHYSELSILHATMQHSGNYTCVPSNTQPASVLVHIFKGDNPAAMHHEHHNATSRAELANCFVFLIIMLCIVIA